MKLIGTQVYASVSELEVIGIPIATLKMSAMRFRKGQSQKWQNITDPADRRVCLINYATIPAATLEKYNCPTLAECLDNIRTEELKATANKAEMAAVERQVLAVNLVEKIEIRLNEMDELRGMGLPEPDVKAYARLAGWIRIAIGVKKNISLYRKVWKDVPTALQACLDQMTLEYRKGILPRGEISHPAVLQRKMKAFEADGLEGIVSKKYGNENRKVMNEVHEAVLVKLYMDSKKYDVMYIYDQYAALMEQLELVPVSYSRVKQYLNSDFIKTATFEDRHGSAAYNSQAKSYISREKPQYGYSLLAGDGLKLGEIVTIPAGHRILAGTKYANRTETFSGQLWIWFWFDVHSGAIAGYEIGISETGNLIRNAMKQAIRRVRDRVPIAVYMDKMWTGRDEIKNFMNGLGIKMQPKMPWNAKESPAERFNKEFNKFHRRFSEQWVNVMGAKSIQFIRKGDQVDASQERSVKEAEKMIRDVIDWYNHQVAGEAKISRWTDLVDNLNPECQTLSAVNRAKVFGRSTFATHDRAKFKIQIESRKYEYQLNDQTEITRELRSKERIRVWMDEEDMQEVYLFRMNDEQDADQDEFLGMASLLVKPQMAISERKEADVEAHKVQKNRNKKAESDMKEFVSEMDQILDRMGILAMLPNINQHLMKEVLTEPVVRQQRMADGIAVEPERKTGLDRFGTLANK